jgi:hypothetical protein
MNASVLAKMESVFADIEKLPISTVRGFFASDASVTFMDVAYLMQYTWPISNTTDTTV